MIVGSKPRTCPERMVPDHQDCKSRKHSIPTWKYWTLIRVLGQSLVPALGRVSTVSRGMHNGIKFLSSHSSGFRKRGMIGGCCLALKVVPEAVRINDSLRPLSLTPHAWDAYRDCGDPAAAGCKMVPSCQPAQMSLVYTCHSYPCVRIQFHLEHKIRERIQDSTLTYPLFLLCFGRQLFHVPQLASVVLWG